VWNATHRIRREVKPPPPPEGSRGPTIREVAQKRPVLAEGNQQVGHGAKKGRVKTSGGKVETGPRKVGPWLEQEKPFGRVDGSGNSGEK